MKGAQIDTKKSYKAFAVKALAACVGLAVFQVILEETNGSGLHLRRLSTVLRVVSVVSTGLRSKYWAGHDLSLTGQDLMDELVARWEDRVAKRNQWIKDHDIKGLWGMNNEPEWRKQNEFGRVFEIFHPDWHCPFAERIGAAGDGGKWICNLPAFEQDQDCVVYALGLFDNDEFERAVHSVSPRCEIHSFDPTPGEIEKFHMDQRLGEYGANFHNYAISSDGADLQIQSMLHKERVAVGSKTLYDTMAELNHDHISVLKVDIEFSEWGLFESLLCDLRDPTCRPLPTDQVLIELHFIEAEQTINLFERMAEHGFGIFSFEPNPIGYPRAAEFAFVRVKDPRA